jgi:hypothetical protein
MQSGLTCTTGWGRLYRRAALLSVFGGLVTLLALPGQAQEPKQKPPKPLISDDDITPRPPDSDAESARQVHLSKSDDLFKAIRDNRPLAENVQRPGEFTAFIEVVKHVRRVPPAALARHSRKYIHYADLAGEAHEQFLRDPIRVQGKLVRLKLIDPDVLLKQKSGLVKLYEGWLYADDNDEQPVCVVFSELPLGLRVGESLSERVTFDGYYFKLLAYTTSQKDDDGKAIWHSAPLLIGQSITLAEPESASAGTADEATQVRLAKSEEIFNSIMDKRPLASLAENYGEYTAYGLVFRHAQKFAPEVLARHSRRDVVYRDLIEEIREQFLRDLLHVEGRLVRLRKRDASERLRETSQIKEIYEGWIYFENEYRHPICVAFTELPPGIKPGESLSYRVAFDGYYFKLMAYPSQEKDDKGKDVWRVAPLMIGRKLELLEDPSPWALSNQVVVIIIGVVVLVFAAAVGLTLWLRRGEQRARAQMHESMTRENPFDEPTAAPVRPGDAWNRVNEPPSVN